MRKIWFIGLLVVVVLISGCYQGPGTGTPNATSQPGAQYTVEIRDFTFAPDTLTVPSGTTVTWVNRDSAPHTATSTTDAFDSGRLEQGQTYSYTFDEAGTFEYSCTVHPSMPRGKVIVT